MIYENSQEEPLSIGAFLWRLAKHFGVAILFLVASLAVGMTGFMCFEGLTSQHAFLHVATMLGGHGPTHVDCHETKIFAGLFGLYADLAFAAAAGVVIAPIGHRVFHFLHQEKQS